MIANQLHALSYLKRVTGIRSQESKVPHVLALPPSDSRRLENAEYAKAINLKHREDLRTWRPRDGWAISRTDQAWLDIPNGYVIVFRSEEVK